MIYNICQKLAKPNNTIVKNIYKQFYQSKFLYNEKHPKIENLFIFGYQKEPVKKKRKITITGAGGMVGTAVCYNILIRNLCNEIVLLEEKNRKEKICGEVLDFSEGSPFGIFPKLNFTLDATGTENSDIIVICSGVNIKKGQSRLDIAQQNVTHLKEIIPPLVKLSPEAVIILVTNPPDVGCYATWKYSGFPKNRITSTGTLIDSVRFRYYISKKLGISPEGVHGCLIGEHGASSVPIWSSVNIAGTKLREIEPNAGLENDINNWKDIAEKSITAGLEVFSMKNYTNWTIALVASVLVESIITDSNLVYTVSVMPDGIYGIKNDCFLSLPCVLGNKGVSKIIKQSLTEIEIKQLQESACIIEKTIQSLKL